jgi:Putative peptidoglycan binding domain
MTGAKAYLAGVLIVAGALRASGAAAADDKGEFGIRGAGLVKCSVFNHEREARSEIYHIVAAWMDGYITGSNQHADDTYDIVSFESTELLAALVSENCKKYPDTPVFAVLRLIVKNSARNRLHAPSKKVEIAMGERKALLYEEVLKRIQQKLASGGFYKGPINGAYDAATQNAMKAYQTSVKLRPTGFPDQLTLWRLLSGAS